MNEIQIADIWLLMKAYIDKKNLDVVAEEYISLLSDLGVTNKMLQSVLGHDDILDEAIDYFMNGDDDEEYELNDEWNDDGE